MYCIYSSYLYLAGSEIMFNVYLCLVMVPWWFGTLSQVILCSLLTTRLFSLQFILMMMTLGVSSLRGFPVGRRGIGCLVPILGGRRLA